jgi:hypothetical protein
LKLLFTEDLNQTAKHLISLNRGHPETISCVRVGGLQLQGDLDGERWGGELCQTVRHAANLTWFAAGIFDDSD